MMYRIVVTGTVWFGFFLWSCLWSFISNSVAPSRHFQAENQRNWRLACAFKFMTNSIKTYTYLTIVTAINRYKFQSTSIRN